MTRRHLLRLLGATFLVTVPTRWGHAAVIATDTFTRANETPLTTPWAQLSGIAGVNTFNLSSNTVVPNNVASSAHYVNNTGTYPNDHYAQAVIAATGGGAGQSSGPGVLVRGSGTNNCYILNFNKAASSNVSLIRYVAGSIALIWLRTQTWVNGDTVRLEASGSTLRAFRNGVQIGADVTDTNLTTGRPGITHFGESGMSAVSIDTWEGGDLGAAAVVTRHRPLFFP